MAVLIPGMRQHKLTWIVAIQFLPLSYTTQPFLGCPLWFHNFFHTGLVKRDTLFIVRLFSRRWLYVQNRSIHWQVYRNHWLYRTTWNWSWTLECHIVPSQIWPLVTFMAILKQKMHQICFFLPWSISEQA